MKQTDEQRARRLLRLREEKLAFRWGYFLRDSRFWIVFITILAMLTYTFAGERGLFANRAIWLIAGVFIGRIARDYIWLKDVVDSVPFLEKVLDWGKVQELASQKEAP
jgi:hypothetical protein